MLRNTTRKTTMKTQKELKEEYKTLLDCKNPDYFVKSAGYIVTLSDEENFAERRMTCKQRCMSNKSCHYCVDQIKFIDTIYRDKEDTLFVVTHGTVIKSFILNL